MKPPWLRYSIGQHSVRCPNGRLMMAENELLALAGKPRVKEEFRGDLLGDYTVKVKNWGLDDVPEEVLTKTSAKVIILSGNRIRTLPPEIGRINTLTVLKIDKNRISELPAEFGSLLALRELHAADNLLNALPVELGAIETLEKMSLSGNPMMHSLPTCDRPLWEVWYGQKAGPMPPTTTECLKRPKESSGTVKMRTTYVLKILRRALKEGSDAHSSIDSSTSEVQGWGSGQTDDGISHRSDSPQSECGCLDPANAEEVVRNTRARPTEVFNETVGEAHSSNARERLEDNKRKEIQCQRGCERERGCRDRRGSCGFQKRLCSLLVLGAICVSFVGWFVGSRE